MQKNDSTEQIFVCPIDQESNEWIAKHPSLIQVEPLLNTDCYFGKNKVELSVYPVEHLFFNTMMRSKILSFYAFKQAGKYGKKQFFDSKNVKKKKADNALATHLAELLEKISEAKEKAA